MYEVQHGIIERQDKALGEIRSELDACNVSPIKVIYFHINIIVYTDNKNKNIFKE